MNIDTVLFLVVETLLLAALVAVRSVVLYRSELTPFELKRRAKIKGDTSAKYDLRRHHAVVDLVALRYIKEAVIIIIIVIFNVAVLGWLLGGLLSLILLLFANVIASWRFVINVIQRLYNAQEPKLLQLAEKAHPVLQYLQLPTTQPSNDFVLHSREELLHLVENAQDVLTQNEKHLLSHAMTFQSRPVKDVMTPKSSIASIKSKELIGPLVLDDLHKSGHSRFPVVTSDIDHVVGILHIQDMLTLDNKKSVTAQKAMDPHVHYIHEDQTLEHALAAFLRTHRHLFIVVNEFRETVGILSLEDVLEALIGRKITDEFDTHEDLRAVAQRNLHKNNDPESRVDV